MFWDKFSNTRYMQYLAAVSSTLSILSCATYVTWSSPSLPKLTSNDSPIGIKLTDSEASWVASAFLLGSIPGGFITGWCLQTFGRKTTLLLSVLPLFLPWIAIIFIESVWLLVFVRALAGCAASLPMSTVSIYNGEISDKDIRGKLGTTFNMLKLTGNLFVLSVGPFISYVELAISSSVFPLIFGLIFYFMPESPYYLIKVSKKDEAKENLIRLSANNVDEKVIDNQLEEIEKTVEYDMQNKSTLWELFTKTEYRRSLLVMTGIKILQQFSGSNAIDAYMQTIIGLSDSSITPEVSSIIFGFIQIPAVLIAAFLVDKAGRKPLLIVSALGCAVALIAEGVYFYLQDVVKADIDFLSWLPTSGLVLYLIMNPIGLFTLPYILLGELFATNIKGLAVTVFSMFGGFLGFMTIKFFEPISSAWGMHTMFWIFAAISILGAVFVYFHLPETKGKTFAEIQCKLNGKSIELLRNERNREV